MKEEFKELKVIKNEDANRFELEVNGHIAFIDYKQKDNDIYLIHTESPKELAGTGAAAALVEKTLIYLEENNHPLVPLCPYVAAFIKKNRDWVRVVREDFKDKFKE